MVETGSRADALSVVLASSGDWMLWNTFLAWLPVALAIGLFRVWERGPVPRRSVGWWCALGLFVLFLPNAPYVVTDLVHLRADVHRLDAGAPIATTVLPLYGLFVLSGFVAYALCLAQLVDYLERAGLGRYRGRITLALHALVAVGIFLGRWSRLNSWEPVLRPRETAHEVITAFAWTPAPVLLVTLFVVTAVGHFVTKAVLDALWTTTRGWIDRSGPRPAV